MRITFDTKSFQAGLRAILPLTKGHSLPILQSVLVGRSGSAYIRATNLEAYAEVPVTSPSIDEYGQAAFDAKALSNALKGLKEKTFTLTHQGSMGFVEAGDSRFYVATFPAEDFPQVPRYGIRVPVSSTPTQNLLASINFVRLAVAGKDETRRALQSVSFGSTGIVATDGRRLHVDENARMDITALLSVESLDVYSAMAMAGKDSGETRIEKWDGWVSFTLESGAYIDMRNLDGRFPNWKNLVPTKGMRTVDVSATDAARAIKPFAAQFVVPTKKSGKLHDMANVLHMQGNRMAMAQNRGSFPCDIPLHIGFNPRFLHDAFASLGKDDVRMMFTDAEGAVVLQGDNGRMVLVMPVRTQEDPFASDPTPEAKPVEQPAPTPVPLAQDFASRLERIESWRRAEAGMLRCSPVEVMNLVEVGAAARGAFGLLSEKTLQVWGQTLAGVLAE